nr:chitooligosaccharidolytic beta-N-acetylglucosaminidase-like [Onthophagus taurus]
MSATILKHIAVAVLVNFVFVEGSPQWRYQCVEGTCKKFRLTPETKESAVSLPACRLFCHDKAGLWPIPSGSFRIGQTLTRLNVNSIDISGPRSDTKSHNLVTLARQRFIHAVNKIEPNGNQKAGGRSLFAHLKVTNPNVDRLELSTDEGYTLEVTESSDGRINATVVADNYFGARHGLETLSQLIIYDDIKREYQMVKDIYIQDKPHYPYRGLILDTARNFMSVDAIKRTIEGMAMSKLNTFHWHITDSHSFPYVSKSNPYLSELGAYSSKMIYDKDTVADIIEFGKVRGVRVMPEFDAPAHVGEGWQDTGYVVCFNAQPWQDYCVEPPCGQLDPTKEGMYDVIEGIYKDMIDQFNPDIFHMGGDEVAFQCWNSTSHIVEWMNERGWYNDKAGFSKLWNVFQSEALKRFDKHAKKKDTPIIMWTSSLTEKDYVHEYLPNDRYIIQIWTTRNDQHIQDLLDLGYRLILSNYDDMYLDCGFGGWVDSGNNWCSPYKGWQQIYNNSPKELAGDRANQMLGAEAALWTEQVDSTSIDSRIFPRISAMGERLWSEPNTNWRFAEERMLVHRERLVSMGINADALEPMWCSQNEGSCPIHRVR